MEKEGGEIEAHAARHKRQDDEQQEVVAGKSGGDGDDLVRDGRDALEQDDPGAPMRIGLAKGLDLVAVAVKLDQPAADRVVEVGADGLAEDATGDRGGGAGGGVGPTP